MAQQWPDPSEVPAIIGAVLFLVAAWVGATGFTALISGWRLLVPRFRALRDFDGPTWSFQSGRMGWSNYNGVLNVGGNSEGLYLRPMLLVSFAHPALFIPWHEIRATTRRWWIFGETVTLRLGSAEDIRFAIGGKLGRRLKEIAGPNWPEKAPAASTATSR